MTSDAELIALDRFIDSLEFGHVPADLPDDTIAGLADTVRELRRRAAPEWPDDDFPALAAAHIADAVRGTSGAPTDQPPEEPQPPSSNGRVISALATPPVPLSAKRRWLKEFGQIAAAAVVLVLVVGLLATLFQNRHEQAGTVGSGATGQQLPITVTANGIAITLGTVEVSNTAMRFTFRVQLPPDAVASTEQHVIDPITIAAGNLQVDGLATKGFGGVSAGGEHKSGEPTTELTVMLNPFVPQHQAVTLTLRQLLLNLTPTSTRVVEGPWTFHLPSALEPSVPRATPDASGLYVNLSVAQAQQLVGFPIIEPAPLPEFLYPQLFNAKVAARNSTAPNWVQLTYTVKNEAANAIIVEESTAGPDDISNASSETMITIHNVAVTKSEVNPTTGQALFYTWKLAGTSFKLTADLSQQVTEPVLEQLVSSMISRPDGDLTPAPITGSPQGAIIFASSRSGNSEIYAVRSDGSAPQQLTKSEEDEFDPIWSPDGTQIAYFQMKAFPVAASYPYGAWPPISIHVMNADGSHQRNLTPEGSRSFRNLVWSPDGKQLAVECAQQPADRAGNGQICVLNEDGTGLHRVVPPQLLGTTPSWSPDGRWIAFRGQASSMDQPAIGIYLVSPDGKQLRTIAKDSHAAGPLAWSPDGTKLAYAFGMQLKKVAVINVDGSGEDDLDLDAASLSDPLWSPDGTRFLFMSGGAVDVINVDGTGVREVVPPKDTVVSAVWSPDGQAIAYTYGVSADRARLDVVGIDGSTPRTLVEEAIGPAGSGILDWPPSWQPIH